MSQFNYVLFFAGMLFNNPSSLQSVDLSKFGHSCIVPNLRTQHAMQLSER